MLNISVRLVAAAGAVALSAAAVHAMSLQDIKDRGFVRIAVANEIPYGYVDPSGEAKGAGPDVARAVLEKVGLSADDIQWIVTNFSSLIPGLQANRFDMVAAELAIRPERCTKVIYSEPNTSYGEGLLVAEGNPKDLHAFTDFKEGDSKVAVMAGADQLQMMQHLGVPADNIVTIATNADAISTVSTGRADAYAATSLTASGLAGKSDKVAVVDTFEDPVIDGKPVRSWGGFAFNTDSTDFRDAISEALVEFKKTSEWSDILKEYGFTTADIDHSSEVTTKQLCAGE